MRARRTLVFLLQGAVSASLLLLLMRGIPWSEVGTSVARASRPALAAFAGASLAGIWLRALRFRLLLPRPCPRAGSILLVTAVQNCLGDFVPGRLASLGSYVYLLVTRFSVGLEAATASFVVSLALDYATLGPLLALAALMRLAPGGPALNLALSPGWIFTFGASFFAASGIVLVNLGPIARLLSRLIAGGTDAAGRAAGSRRRALCARIESLAAELEAARGAGSLLPAFALSLVIRLAKYASLYALMAGLAAGAGAPARPPDFWDLIVGITVTELVASLPLPALGQFGVWEGGLIGAFVLLGFDRELATIVAIGMHGISQAFEYLVGLAAAGLLVIAGRRARAAG